MIKVRKLVRKFRQSFKEAVMGSLKRGCKRETERGNTRIYIGFSDWWMWRRKDRTNIYNKQGNKFHKQDVFKSLQKEKKMIVWMFSLRSEGIISLKEMIISNQNHLDKSFKLIIFFSYS